MLRVYPGIFDQKRSTVFKKLAAFKKYGVLAGGTALTLQIRHRKSFDFDIFLPKPISRHFVYVWYKRLFPVVKTSSIDFAAVGDITDFTVSFLKEGYPTLEIKKFLKQKVEEFKLGR